MRVDELGKTIRTVEIAGNVSDSGAGVGDAVADSDNYTKTANAGTNNYTKYWAEIKPEYQGQPWSAAFVTWCFVRAFGKSSAAELLRHYPYVYCPTMASLFTLHGLPQKGDVVIFKRNGTFVHTGIVTKVNGDYFETIEGNTSGGSTIIANGGGVCKKAYYNSNLPGTKFCRPDYDLVKEEIDMEELKALRAEMAAMEVRYDCIINKMGKEIKELKKPEMTYNYIDENMPEWAREAVQWCVNKDIIKGTGEGLGLTVDKLWTCVTLYRVAKVIAKLCSGIEI